MKAIFSTEKLNSYGFWILTSGINLDRFNANPVLLKQHNSWESAIGKVDNLRIEDGCLVGEITWDEEDEDGAEYKRKYEKGFMRAFSIGIEATEWSEDPFLLKKGQTRATVTKCELYEISAVTLPSNSECVRLYRDGKPLELSAGNDIEQILPKINLSMKRIALAFGLPEDATPEAIIEFLKKKDEAVVSLQAQNNKLQERLNDFEKKFKEERDAKLTALLDNPKKQFTAEQKEHFRKLAALDYDLAIKSIELSADKQTLKEFSEGGEKKTTPTLTYNELHKSNPKELERLKAKEPETYNELYFNQFGKYPKQ